MHVQCFEAMRCVKGGDVYDSSSEAGLTSWRSRPKATLQVRAQNRDIIQRLGAAAGTSLMSLTRTFTCIDLGRRKVRSVCNREAALVASRVA